MMTFLLQVWQRNKKLGLKNKNVQYWRYQKLTRPGGEEYRRCESARVSNMYKRKKLEQEFDATGSGGGSQDEIVIDDNAPDTKLEKVKRVEQNQVHKYMLLNL